VKTLGARLFAALLLLTSATRADVVRVEKTALQPQFTVYGTENGLPSNQIRALHQDADGQLWIGTYGGLASFDGSRFETWRAPNDPRPLVVESIAEDIRGDLWITAEKRGLYRLDRTRQHWLHYGSNEPAPRQLRSDDIWSLAPDAQGGMWLGGYGGGLHYIDADALAHSDDQPGVPKVVSDQIGALLSRPEGLWIGTGDQGLWFVALGAAIAEACEPGSAVAVSALRGDTQHAYAMFNDGRVVQLGAGCATLKTVYRAANTEQIALSILLEDGAISALGLRNGVAWSEPGREALAWLKARPGTPGTLPAGLGQALLKDRESGYWVGVHGGGLAYLPPGADQILFVPHDGGMSGGLRGRSIRGLSIAPDGGMWVGSTDFGLERVDPPLSQVSSWNVPAAHTASRFSVRALASWNARLWIAHREGLWSAPMEGATLGAITAVALPAVHLLLPDGPQLWAAARADALYRLDAAGQVQSRFAPGQLAGQEVNQLLRDPEGNMWVASDGGLQRYDAQHDRLDFDPLIAHGDVASACFQDHSLWRYSDAGLEHFDRFSRKLLRRYETAEGIPALDTATLECRGDTLWLLTRSGFLAWSAQQGRVVAEWRRADGVPAVELGRSTFGAMHRGRYWTGGEGGLLGLTLALPNRQPVGFALRLHAARTQRGDQWIDLSGPRIALQAQDRNLHLSARATVFRSPASTAFSFLLSSEDGIQQSFATQSGELDIARLGAGRHRLQITASHPSLGAAFDQPQLEIVVAPEWYQTAWARISAVLVALLLGFAVIENQRRRLKARHARQLGEQRVQFAERLADEKSRFLAQSSHEMKNLLGGATGMAELIATQSAQPGVRDKANRMTQLCGDLSRLLDDLLDNARLERGQITLDIAAFDPLELCTSVLDDLQSRALQKGLELHLQRPGHSARRLGDALRLRQILSNLLSNAIKYTEQGSVCLSAELDDPQRLRVNVRDSGPGIAPEARERLFQPFALGRNRRDSTGLGLWICKQLCTLCGGTIRVQSDDHGTCFVVELPWPIIPDAVAFADQLVIVGDAARCEPWLQAAYEMGIKAITVPTLLGLLADQSRADPGDEAPAQRVIMLGADAAQLRFAHEMLASRGYRYRPDAPDDPAKPHDYLLALLASCR
jgi:signal transduction histidine kinase/streptogramin lyase